MYPCCQHAYLVTQCCFSHAIIKNSRRPLQQAALIMKQATGFLEAGLPAGWQKLFKMLRKRTVEELVCWYLNEVGSNYGTPLTWHHLFTCLSIKDPSIVDSCLHFKPRFRHFPVCIQHKFLVFLYNVLYTVPDRDLAQFIKLLLNEDTTSMRPILHLVMEIAKTLPEHSIQQLDHKTKVTTSEEDIQMDISVYKEDVDVPVTKGPCDDPDVFVIDEEPPLKRQRLDVEEMHRLENGVMSKNNAGPKDNSTTAESAKDSVAYTTSETSYMEMANISQQIMLTQASNTNPEEFIESVYTGLPEGVEKIKEAWHSGRRSELEESLQSLIASMSDTCVKDLCMFVDFPNMGEDGIEVFTQHICDMATLLSFGCINTLLAFALTEKVTSLTQNASRKLMSCIMQLAESFPKHLIESVFIPCLQTSELLPVHVEVFNRFIKESLNMSSRAYFVEQISRCGVELTDGNLAVFHTLLETDCQLDAEVLTKVLIILSNAAVKHTKNLKFGKLLLAFINRHGKYWTSPVVETCKEIVNGHNTFLKKTLLATLNKL